MLKTQFSSELTRTNTYSPCYDADTIKICSNPEIFDGLCHRQPLYQTSFGGTQAELNAPSFMGSIGNDEIGAVNFIDP